jgi:NADPH:quinone reductase-like Zn-dependent oxidoreductase
VHAVEAGRVRPVVSKVSDLDDVVDSFRYPESNRQFGKIVLTMQDLKMN